MRADKSEVPDGGVGWGELQVEFETLPAGLDTAQLLKGLPGDACPCPHWNYVFKGRFVVRYADHVGRSSNLAICDQRKSR